MSCQKGKYNFEIDKTVCIPIAMMNMIYVSRILKNFVVSFSISQCVKELLRSCEPTSNRIQKALVDT